MIYEFALVVPMTEHDHRRITINPDGSKTKDWVKKIYRDQLTALCIQYKYPVNLHKDPPLLLVSRQVREEGDEVYWGLNRFLVHININQDDGKYWPRIDDDLATPMRQFQQWVKTVGMRRLKYLKYLKLQINTAGGSKTGAGYYSFHPRGTFPFVVKLHKQRGLVVLLPNKYLGLHLGTTEMREHFKTTKMRMEGMRWQGQAIIDFFLRNKFFWSTWFFTYPEEEPWNPPIEEDLEWFEDDDVEGGVAVEGFGGHGKGEGEDWS